MERDNRTRSGAKDPWGRAATAACTFPREFSSIAGQGSANGWATLIPDTFCPSTRAMCGRRFSRLRRQTHARVRRGRNDGHAAASTDGHVAHEADRLASPRARRAAVARDVRSAGIASPVPHAIAAAASMTRACIATQASRPWVGCNRHDCDIGPAPAPSPSSIRASARSEPPVRSLQAARSSRRMLAGVVSQCAPGWVPRIDEIVTDTVSP
jgi:hypothetical protein